MPLTPTTPPFGQSDPLEHRSAPKLLSDSGKTTVSKPWPPGVTARAPSDEARQQADEARRLTRAYRLNLGVLSLMALFVGAFMVFAVHSLSVAQRLPQLALLGVLFFTFGLARMLGMDLSLP